MSWFDDLHDAARRQGLRPHTLRAGRTLGQGRVLVTEYGARVLAVELPGVDENLFFHTTGTDGRATGGDRLWLAPQRELWWASLENARRDPVGTAVTPPSIEAPDVYPVNESPLEVKFPFNVRSGWRSGRAVGEVFRRVDRLLAVPLGVALTQTDELHADFGDEWADVAMWHLLQLPPGGTMVCPTTTRADPTVYFNSPIDDRVTIDDRCVRFRLDGRAFRKFGLQPEHTIGRMGYVRELRDGRCSLIVRCFGVYPGERYIDLPPEAPAEQRDGGDALQVYNDGPGDGSLAESATYGEMEHHDPALAIDGGPWSRTGTFTTHVLAGAREAIGDAGRALLGVPLW